MNALNRSRDVARLARRSPTGRVLLASLLLAALPCWGQVKSSRAMENLGILSDGLEQVTARVLRCVVRITGETYVPEQDPYDSKAQLSSDPASNSEVEGSGILVSSDGYIVTNAHVVSGGPLVDVRGHLLGINTITFSETGGNQGIGLAIPALTVRDVAPGAAPLVLQVERDNRLLYVPLEAARD